MVVLHEILLQCVLSIYKVNGATEIVLLRVVMSSLRIRWLRNCRLTVSVAWEDLRESVAHLQFAIERAIEEGLVRVETAILQSSLGSWRERVVVIFIRQTGFEVVWVDGQGGQLSQRFRVSTVLHEVSSAGVRDLLGWFEVLVG